MKTLSSMFLLQTGGRWIGNRILIDHPEGESEVYDNSLAFESLSGIGGCQIAVNNIGDDPFRWCQASALVGGETTERKYCQALSNYEPNKYLEFTISVQPDNAPGGYLWNGPDESKIYEAAYEKMKSWSKDNIIPIINDSGFMRYGCLPESPRCERLCFISNFSENFEGDEFNIAGWFKPGGTQAGLPPIPNGYVLYGSPASSDWEKRMIYDSPTGYVTAIIQDLGVDSEEYQIPFLGTGASGYLDFTGYTVPISGGPLGARYRLTPEPGFPDPVSYSEQWGAWCPAIAPKTWMGEEGVLEGDIPPSLTQTVTVYDRTWINRWNPFTEKYDGVELLSETPHTYEPGKYDWRFLFALVQRKGEFNLGCKAITGADKKKEITYHEMYWDIWNLSTSPNGPDWESGEGSQYVGLTEAIMDKIHEAGFPEQTLFDVKIQAAVYGFRVGPDMVGYLREGPEFLVEVLSQGSWFTSIWSKTIYKVQVRQSMPLSCNDTWI